MTKGTFAERTAVSTYDLRYQSLDRQLDDVNAASFETIELYGVPDPAALASVADNIARRGLSVVCVNPGSRVRLLPVAREEGVTWVRRAVDAARVLKAPFVNFYPGYVAERDVFTNILQFRERLLPLAEYAAEAGVRLLAENYYDPVSYGDDPDGLHFMREPEATLGMLETLPAGTLGITWDPCNHMIAGVEPWPYAYEVLKEHILYVQLKSCTCYSPLLHSTLWGRSRAQDSSKGEFLHVGLADGAVNWSGILTGLAHHGYDGYLTLEPHASTREAFFEAVRSDSAYIAEHYEAIGKLRANPT